MKIRASQPLASPSKMRQEDRVAIDEPSNLTVTARGELLSVKAYKAPLRDVLEQISRSTGVAFSGDEIDEPVTAEVGPLAVRELVAALLAHTPYGYVYFDAAASKSGFAPARVILVANGKDRGAVGPDLQFGMDAARSAQAIPVDATSDQGALREQHTVESLLEACKGQACDSS